MEKSTDETALEGLREEIGEADQQHASAWLIRARNTLRGILGEQDALLDDLKFVTYRPVASPSTPQQQATALESDRRRSIAVIDAAIESVRRRSSSLGTSVTDDAAVRIKRDSRSVLVVHGRNTAIRDAMFEFLRAIGLQPMEWSEGVAETAKGAPYTGEVIDALFAKAQAIVILLTPDEDVGLRPEFASSDGDPEIQTQGQARPNVFFEAGIAMGRLPNQTIFVEWGNPRPFSDITGRHIVRMSNDPGVRNDLARRLQTAGCALNLSGNDWLRAGHFEEAAPSAPESRSSWDLRIEDAPASVPMGGLSAVTLHIASNGSSSPDGVDVTAIIAGGSFQERPRNKWVPTGQFWAGRSAGGTVTVNIAPQSGSQEVTLTFEVDGAKVRHTIPVTAPGSSN